MYEQKNNQNIGEEFVAIPKRLLSKLWGHYGAEKVISLLVWLVYDSKWQDKASNLGLCWTEEECESASNITESLIGEEDSKELWLINGINDIAE